MREKTQITSEFKIVAKKIINFQIILKKSVLSSIWISLVLIIYYCGTLCKELVLAVTLVILTEYCSAVPI